jgi:hypothetical protein
MTEGLNLSQPPVQGLSERLLREMLRTPAIKELVLLHLKDIKPESASGLVKTFLWEDPGMSLSILGALPGFLNWLAEFLLEMGRQFNNLPEPMLWDFLGRIGEGIDRERLAELPKVYGQLLGRILSTEEASRALEETIPRALNAAVSGMEKAARVLEEREEAARALAASLDRVDAVSLGAAVNRLVKLGNRVRESRTVPLHKTCRTILEQLEPREVRRALAGTLKDILSMGASFFAWCARAVVGRVPRR